MCPRATTTHATEDTRWRDGETEGRVLRIGEGDILRHTDNVARREGKGVCACLTGDRHCCVNQNSCIRNICQACRKGLKILVTIVSIVNTTSERNESGLHETIITADHTEDRTCTTSSKYSNLSPILSYVFLSRSVSSLVSSIKVEQGERSRGKSSVKEQRIMLCSSSHRITS
jgi:hypothetical protein